MKNLIVPVSIKTNSLSNDRITVGIMGVSNNGTMFEFSNEKVKKINSFLDKDSGRYVISALNSLKINLPKINNFKGLDFSGNSFNEEFLPYLSAYSKGLIHFGKPKGFSLELNVENFKKAFSHFVGIDNSHEKIPLNSFRKQINNFLKNEAFEKIDINYSIDPSLIKGLYAPHKVDFIGVNGSPFAGLGIDFSKSPEEVDKSIVTFNLIATSISKLAESHNMPKGKYEIYFNEPVGFENKKLLETVIKDSNKEFDLIEVSKFNSVVTRISNGKFRKFSESELIS